MGWTVTYRREPIKDYYKHEIEACGRYKVLECKIVKLRELYAAILDTQTNTVSAEVWLLQHYKTGYNFGYKSLPDTCYPYYFNCPKSVLDLLTPTENKYAKVWRIQCQETINQRNELKQHRNKK
jgi:hypothetical protein